MTEPCCDVGDPVHDVTTTLNSRDLLVLEGLAEGRSTAAIAADLSISSNTARTRIRKVQRKFGVTDRAATVRAARERGVLDSLLVCSGC